MLVTRQENCFYHNCRQYVPHLERRKQQKWTVAIWQDEVDVFFNILPYRNVCKIFGACKLVTDASVLQRNLGWLYRQSSVSFNSIVLKIVSFALAVYSDIYFSAQVFEMIDDYIVIVLHISLLPKLKKMIKEM